MVADNQGVRDQGGITKHLSLALRPAGLQAVGKDEDDCQVCMQRVDALLIVEDNGSCGGAAVTFTGFYRRKALSVDGAITVSPTAR
jgi:hypothetical protein